MNHSSLRLRVVATGGPLQDPSRVARALERFGQAGFAIDNAIAAERSFGRFAGTDAERLADLSSMLDPQEPMPDLLIPTRGGYGTVRLLDQIDYPALSQRMADAETVFVGYSDMTALQLALLATTGMKSFSGPMLNADFGAPRPSRFTMEWFRRVMSDTSFRLPVMTGHTEQVAVEGTLWGGNLAVLCQLIGTPYLPVIEGGILFIEDVGEELYRIERMLFQLLHSGVLARQQAVLIGRFTGAKPDYYDPEGYTETALLDVLRSRLTIPVLTGLPIGHVPDIVALPVGGHARLTGQENGYVLEVSDYPTLGHRAGLVDWSVLGA